MKGIICFLLVLCCSSCATIKTLDPIKNHINISHQGKKSYCNALPRIYSGSAYNFCLMYGEPSRRPNVGDSINGIPFVLVDTVFSLVSDTLVLPYTVLTQVQKGPIKVN